MAREEARLIHEGKTKFNQELLLAMPGRTLESIKGRRRLQEYKDLVRHYSAPPEVEDEEDAVAESTQGTANADSHMDPDRTMELFSDDAFEDEDHTAPVDRLYSACYGNLSQLKITESDLDDLKHKVLRHTGSDEDAIQLAVDREYDDWRASWSLIGPHNNGKTSRRAKPTSSAQATTGAEPGNQVPREAKGRRGEASGVRDKSSLRPSRKRRREQYARVQTQYRNNRSRCAKSILTGDWATEAKALPLDQQVSFWKPLMETQSKGDERTLRPVFSVCEEVEYPVTVLEVEEALKGLADGSPGPDRVNRAQLKSVSKASLSAHMSFWLWCRCPPSAFREGITTLVPKSASAAAPGEFRPITVATIIARLFHRLLAIRLERLRPLSPRQKAFRRGDGLADNVWLLRSLLRDRTKAHKQVCVTFIDVAKAFDSVSHKSMILAARRVGVPERLLTYISSLYRGTVTRLKVDGALSEPITVQRGVRQGDPLSPLLFNYVMDWVLAELDPEMGISLENGLRLNHLAFADDVALVTQTKKGTLRLASQLENGLAKVGLQPNAKKSATLAILVDGRSKRWVCDTTPYLKLAGNMVPIMGIGDVYRYLGVAMGSRRAAPSVRGRLTSGLAELKRAPLKPQQRMFILRVHLIPSLYHQLVLDEISQNLLRDLDRLVRKSVREWCRLAKDVPTSMFHARPEDGGYGIPCLCVKVRIMRRDRITKLRNRAEAGGDPVLKWLVGNSPTIERETGKHQTIRYQNRTVQNKRDVDRANAATLHSSVDGEGLKHCNQVRGIHRWVTDGTKLMTGRNYVGALQLRSNCLYTKGRAARGRPAKERNCDLCGVYESLSHVLQKCARTWSQRTRRHDSVVELVDKLLRKHGFETEIEPSIRTAAGIRKPDIVAWREGACAIVTDVTIVSDMESLDYCHSLKVTYYNVPEIRAWVSQKANINSAEIRFSAVAINWRGAISKLSSKDLKDHGIPVAEQVCLAARVVERGYHTWVFSRKST